MAELSASNSSKTLPTRIVAITDGASLGDIETACISPTTSSCGTVTLSATMRAIQPRMIGIANRRIHLAMPLRRGCSAGMTASSVGVLITSSPDMTGGLTVAPVGNVPAWHSAELLPGGDTSV
jgi:hypothetical protein